MLLPAYSILCPSNPHPFHSSPSLSACPSGWILPRIMQSSAWRNMSIARNHLRSPIQCAPLHSTAPSLAKWKSKWDCKGERRGQKPSKTYVRYVVRQKRAEAKKALKDHLLFGKYSHIHFQDENVNGFADSHGSNDIPRFKDSQKSRSHSSSHSRKGEHGGSKGWRNQHRSYDFCNEDDYVNPEMIFKATFGGHQGFTWSYISWENFRFSGSTSRSWRTDESRWSKARERVRSESDADEDSTDVDSHVHRVTLGLPPTGPLKLDDVKNAFHASALKWHPDKHQAPSQSMASEKFKLCVTAYNSLCSALKPT